MRQQLKITLGLGMLSLSLHGCLFDSDDSSINTESQTYVWTTDYQSGTLLNLLGDSLSSSGLDFNGDSKPVVADGHVFVLERFGADNLVLLDHGKVSYQVALPDYSNPSDVVVAGKTGYVAGFDNGKIYQFVVATGEIQDSLDLTAFAQAGSTSPNIADLELVGDTLVVLMQRMAADWSINQAGLLALYSLTSGKLLDSMSLQGYNPQAMVRDGNSLYIGHAGDMMNTLSQTAIKGLEKVELVSMESTMIITDDALGGGIFAMDLDAQSHRLYLSIYKAWGDAPLAIADVSTNAVLVKAVTGIEDSEGGVAVDQVSGDVYVGDRSVTKPALYRIKRGEATVQSLGMGKALKVNGFAIEP